MYVMDHMWMVAVVVVWLSLDQGGVVLGMSCYINLLLESQTDTTEYI